MEVSIEIAFAALPALASILADLATSISMLR